MNIAPIILISFVLWLAEIFILYILFFFFLWENFYFGQIFEDTVLFIIFIGSVMLFSFAYFTKFPGYEAACLVSLVALPFIIARRNMDERRLKEKRINNNKKEIEKLNKYIEIRGGDSGPFLKLGYLYKEIEDYENALKNFKKACEATKANILTVTEREIRTLEHEINKKEDKEVISFKPIYISIAAIFIISALLFWISLGFNENLTFYILILLNIFMFAKNSLQERYK